MKKVPVIAIFDIGKTNKKILLFDESYTLIDEQSERFEEIVDEDGFPCEDLERLSRWILDAFLGLKQSSQVELRAVNFTTYGASMVHLDESGRPVTPLYNYLKPYDERLLQEFTSRYNENDHLSRTTASPVMGHLNAGLQLYWLRHRRQEAFERIVYMLHFPQYLSYLLTSVMIAETTNLGCHSLMWDFKNNTYHSWLREQGIIHKLCDLTPGSTAHFVRDEINGGKIAVGTGLHDSSAAIIPYLKSCKDPFVILSTGTWSISLNPFNADLPAVHELQKGCLSYLSYEGNPVKTAMLFAGNDHDQQVARIAEWFDVKHDFYKDINPDPAMLMAAWNRAEGYSEAQTRELIERATTPSFFGSRALEQFADGMEAYCQLVADIVYQQRASTRMVLGPDGPRHIYVDGGFSKNEIYLQLIAHAFTGHQVYAAAAAQGTALGAALAIHGHWNRLPIPKHLLQLTKIHDAAHQNSSV